MATNTVNFFQPGTEAAIDASAIARQRQIAEMLMQRGMTSPEGQMVSGHFVAPSKAAYVSQLVSALVGGLQSRQADERERTLAQTLAAGRAKEANDFLGALNGTPARTIAPVTPNDDEGNPMPVAQVAATPADRNRALAIALASQSPQMQAMGGELMKRQMDAADFAQALAAARGGSAPAGAAVGDTSAGQPSGGLPPPPAGNPSGSFGLDPAAFALSASPNARAQALGKMVQEANKPNWVNVGGNLVNTSAPGFAGGIQDQVNFGTDGRANILRSNGGNPVVGAIPGSLETFRAFENAKNISAAQNTPGRPQILPGGRMGGQSQYQEIYGGPTSAPLPAPQPGVTGNFQGDPQQIVAAIQNIRDPQERANAMAALEQQMRAQGGGPAAANAPLVAVPGGGLEFSPQEKAAQDADKARLVDTAKADVVRDTGRAADTKKSAQMQSVAQQAMQLLGAGPTASGVGALADSALNFVGQPSRSGNAAQQLEALSGWLVANVPRMEGPQSDADVRNYAAMAGRVGDRTLPVEARKAALQTVIELQNKYAALNGGTVPSAAAPAPAANGLPPGWTVKVR